METLESQLCTGRDHSSSVYAELYKRCKERNNDRDLHSLVNILTPALGGIALVVILSPNSHSFFTLFTTQPKCPLRSHNNRTGIKQDHQCVEHTLSMEFTVRPHHNEKLWTHYILFTYYFLKAIQIYVCFQASNSIYFSPETY